MLFFFFQAEDGIRDWSVTGVQTCALPIYLGEAAGKPFDEVRGLPGYESDGFHQWPGGESLDQVVLRAMRIIDRLVAESPGRSEERRVGKEGREGGEADTEKKRGDKKPQ